MPGGTYSLEVTNQLVPTGGNWSSSDGLSAPFTNANLSNIGWGTGSPLGSHGIDTGIRCTFSLVAAAIKLNGAAAIAWAGLPFGWLPTSAILDVRLGAFNLVTAAFIQFDRTTEQAVSLVNGHKLFTHPNPAGLSSLDLFSNGWGVRLVTTADSGINVAVQGIGTPVSITGSYLLQSYTTSISGPVTNDVNNRPRITIQATDLTIKGLLDLVKEVTVSYVDAAGNTQSAVVPDWQFISQNQYVLILFFPWPSPPNDTGTNRTFPNPPVRIPGATISGTAFGGSQLLGTIPILFESGSGIYSIVKNKRHDTLYLGTLTTTNNTYDLQELEEPLVDNQVIGPNTINPQFFLDEEELENDIAVLPRVTSLTTPDTLDVKIPDPFIKTGFIGG